MHAETHHAKEQDYASANDKEPDSTTDEEHDFKDQSSDTPTVPDDHQPTSDTKSEPSTPVAMSEPLPGRFWDTSDSESTQVDSAKTAPITYWPMGSAVAYDSAKDQEAFMLPESSDESDSHSRPTLQSSSSTGSLLEDFALPHPNQFRINDSRLKRRITQLLLQRPSYKTIMKKAWEITVSNHSISVQPGTTYLALMAVSLIEQYKRLRRTEPHWIDKEL